MGLLTIIPGERERERESGRRCAHPPPAPLAPRCARRPLPSSSHDTNQKTRLSLRPPTTTHAHKHRRLPQLDRPLRLARRGGVSVVGHSVLLLRGADSRKRERDEIAPSRCRRRPALPPPRLAPGSPRFPIPLKPRCYDAALDHTH
jgi:hypothetical protein